MRRMYSKEMLENIVDQKLKDYVNFYTHYITLETAQSSLSQYSGTLILRVVSSSNIPVDSLTDLNTLLHNTEKTIDCSGFFTITERGKTYNIFNVNWRGNVENSTFGYIGEGLAEDSNMSVFTTAPDVVESISGGILNEQND